MTNEIGTTVFVREEFYESFEKELKEDGVVFPSRHVKLKMKKCGLVGEHKRFLKVEIKLIGEGEEKYLAAIAILELAGKLLTLKI